MADFLTHLFLPLTAAYVLRRDLFQSPLYLGVGAFGLLADLDKLLGRPGLLHSLVTLVPLCLVVLGVERWWRGESKHGPLIVALVLSHLVLDFLDGGPVPLLFPLIETGVGLEYPVRTVFGQGPIGLTFEGPLVRLRTSVPSGGFNTYGFINGFGVANALLFLIIYFGSERRRLTARS
jgi:hypothetical protein